MWVSGKSFKNKKEKKTGWGIGENKVPKKKKKTGKGAVRK
jgi:hypothetical protein